MFVKQTILSAYVKILRIEYKGMLIRSETCIVLEKKLTLLH